jgi:pSer/pThr/pTyr-binding forkhead associated (FHA) protein
MSADEDSGFDVVTVLDQRAVRPSAGRVGFLLQIVAGPDAGRSLIIPPTQPSRVLVGQGPSCDLGLTDRAISRRHLGFELADGGLRVADLGSTNGTRVNGAGITERQLHDGDTISVGDSQLRFEAS